MTTCAVDWLSRDQELVEGLDHLGVQVVSANIYAQLVPGISNVTDRARYFSFHPWVLHSFAREAVDRSPDGWRRWIRRHEYTYSVAAAAAEREHDPVVAKHAYGGMIGATKARAAARGPEVDIDAATRLESGKAVKGHYFKNPQGGYAQYYKGPLTVLGVLRRDEEHKAPDRQLTTYAGVKLAESVESIQAFRDLRAIAGTGAKVAVAELAALGRVVHPGRIDPDGEEARLLRGLLLGDDDDLCAGQPAAIRRQRRQSLALALHYLAHGDLEQTGSAWEFRWCVLASQTHGGRPWHPPAALRTSALAWATYAQNELLNYALECVLWAALQVLDAEPCPPRELAARLAAAACGALSVPEGDPADALPEALGDAIDAHRPLAARPLYTALGKTDTPDAKAGRAVRLMLQVAADRGRYAGVTPFSTVPHGVEIVQAREIHLEAWWQRADAARNERTREFLERLVLDWVLYRHLRVATRKLATQHDYTFRFRPEAGLLFKCSDMEPTFTNPRLYQGIRMMADVGLVSHDLTHISPSGRALMASFA